MREDIVDDVLRAAGLVPSGRVVTYGDLAELVGAGPRQVGWVMRHFGHEVPWWRVVNAAGDPPPFLRDEVFRRWREEGIAVKPNGRGCRIGDWRADLEDLGRAYDAVGP